MRNEVSLAFAIFLAALKPSQAGVRVRITSITLVELPSAVCKTLGTSSTTRAVCYKDNKHQQHHTAFTSGRRRMHLNNRTVKQRC